MNCFCHKIWQPIFYFTIVIALFFFSCENNDNPAAPQEEETTGSVTDMDGNEYKTVKIGNQWWMAENLRIIKYNNGETIPNITSNTEWINLYTGARCNYNNNSIIMGEYGALYNWYTVNDSRGIAPWGWHIPTEEDWQELEAFLGLSQEEINSEDWRGESAGGKLKQTGTEHWDGPNDSATNETGFEALPGGFRIAYDGLFQDNGNTANFWSSSGVDNNAAWSRSLISENGSIARSKVSKKFGFSVRCVKD